MTCRTLFLSGLLTVLNLVQPLKLQAQGSGNYCFPEPEEVFLFFGEYNNDYRFLPFHENITKHDNFALFYWEPYEQATWVAYELTKAEVLTNSADRKDFRYQEDTLIKTGSASSADFQNTTYDRGHLAPAEDFNFSKKALSSTFLYSNISPQKPGFNRGIWRKLEEKTREWALEFDRVYVITGGVFKKSLEKIGPNRVVVPGHFYKIIYDFEGEEKKMIAFLIPHEKTNKPLQNFTTTVDKIESLTNIDFFSDLPDDQQKRQESLKNPEDWFIEAKVQ